MAKLTADEVFTILDNCETKAKAKKRPGRPPKVKEVLNPLSELAEKTSSKVLTPLSDAAVKDGINSGVGLPIEAEPFISEEDAEIIAKAEPEQIAEAVEAATITDNVNHPAHYTQGKFEVIDIIEQAVKPWDGIVAVCVANVIKYVMRAPYKGNTLEDLKKARWYLDKAIDKLSE